MTLSGLAEALRASRGFAHKRDIDGVMDTLAGAMPGGAGGLAAAIPVGDDCAAIRDGEGYLLFAIEGFVNDFVAAEPWFAGYCGVMVNVSDVAAMGGRPLAVVDAVWSAGDEHVRPILQGMAAASAAYGVPIVGGHTNSRNDRSQLSVAILGRANELLTSFDARPGDHLLAAIDLRGRWRDPYPYWDASTSAPAQRLRSDIALLPAIAESRLCRAAKDISMAGTVGTAMMLLECSGLGATIDVTAIPRPPQADLVRWLTAFPSFGYVLAVAPQHLGAVVQRFSDQGIACADIGRADDSGRVRLTDGAGQVDLWDFNSTPLIGCGAGFAGRHEHAR
jgi:AIR synthase-related protein